MSDSPPAERATRSDFHHFVPIHTRWNDLDAYRHVNNVRYYAFFDTAIMHYLQVVGGFDVLTGPTVPFTVENGCRYFRSFTFPDVIEVGLRVARVGNSSVRYELGLFRQGAPELHASGFFVDVFVDAATQAPIAIPAPIRAHLLRLAGA